MKGVAFFTAIVCSVGFGCSMNVDDEPSGELVETVRDQTHRFQGFDVSFRDCVESIGVTLVDTESATARVPFPFVPVGMGTPFTPLVVRSASCQRISIDGGRARAGAVVQIGAVIVPPDGTGDIDNYTLAYYSDDRGLVDTLKSLGIFASFAPIAYRLGEVENAEASLEVVVKGRAHSRLRISGTVVPSSTPVGSFVANWWAKTQHGSIKLSTSVPAIALGSASLVLDTEPGGELSELFAGASISFPILQQFNGFSAAAMDVSLVD
jgi:hypothetical protein